MKRWGSFLIAVWVVLALSACSAAADQQAAADWRFPDGAAPETEYARAFWYGFAPEDSRKQPDAGITEREMTALLSRVIAAAGGDAAGWNEMTAGASDEAIYRDYGAMLLLYAAERMDATDFSNGYAPYLMGGRTDEDWEAFGTDIRGGYPLFETGAHRWERTCSAVSAQMGEQLNYLNASQNYAISRLSRITGAPLLDFSYDSFTMELTRPLTYEAGAVAAVRLFESLPETAVRFPEQETVNIRAAALLEEAKQRRDAILRAPTGIVKGDTRIPGETYTGTAYYLSNAGDDRAAGTSPETAWRTIDRLNRAALRSGDAVFFRRGDVWRAAQVESRPGVTYTAYGQGEKPGLYGSVENGGSAEKWSLWYEGDDGRKIWVYDKPMLDCGAIYLQENLAAEKVQGFWNGQTFQVLSAQWLAGQGEQTAADQAAQPEFDPAVHLTRDLTFFSQASSGLPDTLPVYLLGWVDTGGREQYCLTADGPLYLRCDKGNPGALYKDMEFLSPYAPFDGVQDDVVIDNLTLRYTGRNLLSVAPECGGVLVQNCDLGWGGGCAASYALDSITGYAAGVQRNGGVGGAGSSRNTFRRNYVHESFQEGLGLETAMEFSGAFFDVTDVVFAENVFYHCASPLLYFNWDEQARADHQFRNISFRDNDVFYSGMARWTDHESVNGSFLIDGGPNLQDGTVEVRDNVFFAAEDCAVYVHTYVPEYLPDFEGNCYAQFSDALFFASLSAPNCWSGRAQTAVHDLLGDADGEILILSRPRWEDAAW